MIVQKNRGLKPWTLEKILDIVSDFRLCEDHDRADGKLGEKDSDYLCFPSDREYTVDELKDLESELQRAIDIAWKDASTERLIEHNSSGHYEVTYYDGDGNTYEFECTSDKDFRAIPNLVR